MAVAVCRQNAARDLESLFVPRNMFYLVDHLSVWALDPDVDVEESSLGPLEHQPHLRPHLDLVEEALLGVRVNLKEDTKTLQLLVEVKNNTFLQLKLLLGAILGLYRVAHQVSELPGQ